MKSNCYSIYIHTSPSGKVYIGITSTSVKKRWGHGCNYRGMHFYNAIEKYGWDNFKHDVLFEGLSEEDAKTKEIELIALYDSINPDKGYNVSEGGDVRHHTEETRKKMSQSRKGKPHHKQWVENLSKAQKGVAILAYSPSGEFIREHGSIMDCARFWGLSEGTVRDCCNGKIRSARGIRFIYKDESRRKEFVSKRRKVKCVETGEIFDNCHQAGIITGICSSNIHNVLIGQRKTTGGYHWVYVDNEEETNIDG